MRLHCFGRMRESLYTLKYNGVVISGKKRVRSPLRCRVETLKNGLDRPIHPLPRQDIHVFQPFEAMCVVVNEMANQPCVEVVWVLDVEIFTFSLHTPLGHDPANLENRQE